MLRFITFFLIVNLFGCASMDKEAKGIIGEATEGGYPVIYSFVNELPAKEIRRDLNWLVVISWKYDGVSNNGMPSKDLTKV